MSSRVHRATKPSGAEWLGEVPAHWSVARLKWSAISCRNGIWGDEPTGGQEDIACVRVADFDRTRLTVRLVDPTMRSVTMKERSGRLLDRGNLLLEKSGGGEGQPVGAVVLFDDDQAAVCSNFVARLDLAKDMVPSFWRYVHAAAYAVRLTTRSINQTSGIQNLDQSSYLNELAPFPPPSEQHAIASFLDRETAKINVLVEEQRRLIDLLKEKRQGVISHAVTKGLDPNAKMKPSGVEWLGDVPAHWKVHPLKYLTRFESGGTPSKANPDYWEGDIPWVSAKDLKSANLSDTLDHITAAAVSDGAASLVPASSVVVLVRGMMLARAFPVVQLDVPMAINQDLKALVGSRLQPEYLAWTLRGLEAESLSRIDEAGHGTKALRMEAWTSMELPEPPLQEQELIANHIVNVTVQLDSLSANAAAAIDLLQERRSALISAAVTGKIDVRDYQPAEEVAA